MTGPVLIGCSLPLLGLVPIGRSLALSRFDGCRVKRLDITVVPRHKIQIGTAFKLNHDHDRDHMGMEKERKS
jgi:hypothetical protein